MPTASVIRNEYRVVIYRSPNAHVLSRAEIQTATQGHREAVVVLLQKAVGWSWGGKLRARMRQTPERVDERRERRMVAGFEFRPCQKVIHSSLELGILRCGRAGGIADGRLAFGAELG